METRALRYFQAVAEFGSLSRGAAFLHVSQPAISRQIRALEAEAKVALFIRHGHGVSLTEAGRLLLARSQSILRQLDQAWSELGGDSAGPSGTITFALPPAAGHFLIPPLAGRLARTFPHVFLKVVGGFSGHLHEWLLRGQVDLACIHDPLPQRRFETVPLVREEAFVVGRAGSFPFRRAAVPAEALGRLPMILPSRPNASRRLLDARMAAENRALELAMEVDDPSIIRALLRQGAGFSVLSQGAIEAEVRHRELEARPFHPRLFWQLALVTPAGTARSDILASFARMVQAVAHELASSGAWPGSWIGPARGVSAS